MADNGAEEYKTKGNAAFKAADWDEAIKNYNKAIQLDPKQASFYSNRAACWSSKGNHESALGDAKRCIEADTNFIKGYSRKGKALFDLGRLDEAEKAYKEGLEKDASNPGCTQGISDVAAGRARAGQARSSGGGGFGGFGGMGGLAQKAMELFSGGRFGRMQMYAVVAIGYFMYNTFNKGSSGSSSSSSSGHDVADDAAPSPSPTSTPPRLRRDFKEVDGSWVSFLEAGGRADTQLLFLHRTSLSAESEYGAALGRVLEKATSPPAGGLKIMAPDRPCHGFTPCPGDKKGADGSWLEGLLSSRKQPKKLVIVASGRVAARQAFAIAHERSQASKLLLISPNAMGPSRGSLADVADLQKWLGQQQKAGIATASAAAEAARWATVANPDEDEEDDKLSVSGLPEGSQVATLYAAGEKEDTDLKEELEGLGLPVKVRVAETGDAFLEALVAEAWRFASGADADEEEAQDV